MTIVPKRLALKFNLKDDPAFAPKDIVPIFQRWIQEHAVEGLLIDVVDYKHVEDGPGIVLIADEGDYSYDLGDGQVGLRYTRKRFLADNLLDALRLVFRLTLIATQRLKDEEALGDVRFDYASAQIIFLDRQHYRNQPEAFEAVQADLVAFLSELYGSNVTVSRAYDDPRDVFSVNFSVLDSDVDIDQLIARTDQPLHLVP